MSTSEPPPGFVPLWPISRGPLLSGQIVRLENGELAEWYPLPEGWAVPFVSESDPIPDGSLALPSETGQGGPKLSGPRDVISFQPASDSAPGWILIPRRDDPTLDRLLAKTCKPSQKAGVLGGFAAFIRSQSDKDPVLLYPALIYAPFAGLLKADKYNLECLNYPSAKDRKAIWSDFFSAGPLGGQESSTILANVDDDAGKYLHLADLLVRENDPDRAASFLEHWASGILKAEKKRQKEKRIFWVLSVAALGLILACALIGRFAREQFDARVRAQREIKQNENLRDEQIQSLVLWGRRMRESLPLSGLVPTDEGRLGLQLSKEERKQWQDWLALASTFEAQDNSEPELMMLRADAHHILGQTDQARQLIGRVASGTGPRAALACLAMSHGSPGKDGARNISQEERKGWLDQADNVLDPEDDSPFADLVRAITGFSQEVFCRENNAFSEAEKLRSESLDLVWELIETRTRERHMGLAPYALCLLFEHLDPKDRKLAKVGNLLEETIARNPAFFDLYRVKNSRLALIQRDAQTPAESLALGLAHIQAVINMAGRYPERLEKRPEEILSALDLVDEFTLMVVDAPSQNGFEEIWFWAMAQTQSLLNRAPRDSNYLRLMGRAWVTGARVATRISGGEAVAYGRMEKGLGIWNLLERLQGPKEEIRLARARTLAEMAAFSLEMGRTRQFEELDNACQTILSTLLQENPGAVVAMDAHFRSRWMQALILLSKKDIKKAKNTVSGLVNRIASFPPGRDPSDQKQVRLLLIQAKLLELNLALRELTEKGKTNWFMEWKSIRDSLTRIPDDPDNREELARIRARLALLEWSMGPEPLGKPDPSKPPTGVSGSPNELLEKKAREAISQAVWEPGEARNLFSIWKVGP